MQAETKRRRGGASRIDRDELLAGTLARLVKSYPDPSFTSCGWNVGRDTVSVRQLAQRGIDSDAQRGLVEANLLTPLAVSGVRIRDGGAEFELTRDALALISFARAATELEQNAPAAGQQAADSHPQTPGQLRPHYDVDLREVAVARVAIIRLPTQARTLAVLLQNLEAGEWKAKVHCPLKGHPDALEPQHLYDAASRLTRRQPLIEFHADDGACRWCWKRLPRLLSMQCSLQDRAS